MLQTGIYEYLSASLPEGTQWSEKDETYFKETHWAQDIGS